MPAYFVIMLTPNLFKTFVRSRQVLDTDTHTFIHLSSVICGHPAQSYPFPLYSNPVRFVYLQFFRHHAAELLLFY